MIEDRLTENYTCLYYTVSSESLKIGYSTLIELSESDCEVDYPYVVCEVSEMK